MRTRATKRGLAFAVLLLAFNTVVAIAAPDELQPFTATYSITWHGMSAGNAQIKLERLPDGDWSYSQQTTAHGFFRLVIPAQLLLHSVFRIQDDRLVPETFTSQDGTSGDANDQNLVFDWATGHVHGTVERKSIDLPTQPGLVDTLSVQVALMHELLAGRTPAHFVLLDKDRIKDYLYTPEGRERLQTDAGTYDAVIFRSSRPGSGNGTWFWCAPELGYLPLKVERRNDKDVQWSMSLQQVTH